MWSAQRVQKKTKENERQKIVSVHDGLFRSRMENTMEIGQVFTLIGGLGLFFYGMELMSKGIEKSAGAKLRDILEALTKNRFMGFLVGLVVTAIIQSSSATTVMVVSFVNSGLMTLLQSTGIILGANVGTTITSQLVAFDLDLIAPLILFVGVAMVIFIKNPKVKKFGEVVLGFGVLFVGLTLMKNSMGTLKDSQFMENFFASLRNPILAVLFGFIITAIGQSSSVTVSIILLLASQGMVELQVAFFAILGCNVGSCTTALLASMSGKKDAKRAAMVHFLFNVIGTIVIATLLMFVREPLEGVLLKISGGDPGRAVANAHTLFKVFQVLILAPFAGLIVKLTYILVRGEDEKETQFSLQYIGENAVFSPATAVVEATKEMVRMAEIASTNLNRAMNCLMTMDEDDIDEVYRTEKNINMMNHAITDYLVKVNASSIPIDDRASLGSLFHVVNDIERIGDHAENVADAARSRIEKNIDFSKECIDEMNTMLEMVNTIVQYSVDMFSNNNQEHLQEIVALEDKIDRTEKQFQENHVVRLTNNQCTPDAGMIFSDILSGMERVADHATNIAYSILEGNRQKTITS